MTLPIYPPKELLPGLKYSSTWSPTFFNMPTATTATGADIDLALAQYPLHDFTLSYEFLRDGLAAPSSALLSGLEFRTLFGFFLQMTGTVGRFLYRNPDDRIVWRNRIGLGDGSTTAFTLTRTFGANGYFGTEPVGQVDVNAEFSVYLNGSATPVNPNLYTISIANPCANTINFATPPANGYAIDVDMSYFYYCKLADNSNSFEKFMNRLWTVQKVKLHSCRPGA